MRIERIHKEIYDGESEGFYEKGISFNIGCTYYNVRYSELNHFKNLKTQFSKTEFVSVLTKLSITQKHPFESYVSQLDGSLGYFVYNNNLVIISYREHQPGRYKVYMEGRIERSI